MKFFMKFLLLNQVFWSLITPTMVWAEDPYYRKLPVKFETAQRNEVKRNIFGEIIYKNVRSYDVWNDQQRQKLSWAAEHVSVWMLRPEVAKCALDNFKTYFHEQCPVSIDSSSDYTTMFNNQMAGLLRKGFPQIHIKRLLDPAYADFAGLARTGSVVTVKRAGNDYTVEGKYEISISPKHVDSANSAAGLESIGGVIAHEMLHNMCHTHRNGYTDGNFNTVFGDCVQNKGVFTQRLGLALVGSPGLLLDRGTRNPLGGRVNGVTSESGMATLQPDVTHVVPSNSGSTLTISRPATVVHITGKWTVDSRNFSSVNPVQGHLGNPNLDRLQQYKLVVGEPFGRLLIELQGNWVPVTVPMLLPAGTYRLHINDRALTDNEGTAKLMLKWLK